MARLVWAVPCRRALWDKRDESVSLIDVIEGIEIIDGAPPPGQRSALRLDFDVVTFWTRSRLETPEHVTTRLQIRYPSGKRMTASETEFDLRGTYLNSRLFTKVPVLPLREYGRHEFIVQLRTDKGDGARRKWSTVARLPFDVKERGAKDAGSKEADSS